MIFTNSHQPFLFRNSENQLCSLYCSLKPDQLFLEIKFYNDISNIRPWQIKFFNFETSESYFLDVYFEDSFLGKPKVFCNPHIIENNIIANIGFQKDDFSPMVYRICQANFSRIITNFEFLRNEYIFSGTIFNNQIVCNNKRDKNLVTYSLDKRNRKTEIITGSYQNLIYEDIYKIQKIWNENKFVFTIGTENNFSSFILDDNFNVISEIKNLENTSIYKSSILDNFLLYAEKNEKPEELLEENRSLIFQIFSNNII